MSMVIAKLLMTGFKSVNKFSFPKFLVRTSQITCFFKNLPCLSVLAYIRIHHNHNLVDNNPIRKMIILHMLRSVIPTTNFQFFHYQDLYKQCYLLDFLSFDFFLRGRVRNKIFHEYSKVPRHNFYQSCKMEFAIAAIANHNLRLVDLRLPTQEIRKVPILKKNETMFSSEKPNPKTDFFHAVFEKLHKEIQNYIDISPKK